MKRSDELILLINEHSGPSPDDSYWLPLSQGHYSQSLAKWVWVVGGGDYSALRALERRGLIIHVDPNLRNVNPFGYRITQPGREYCEQISNTVDATR